MFYSGDWLPLRADCSHLKWISLRWKEKANAFGTNNLVFGFHWLLGASMCIWTWHITIKGTVKRTPKNALSLSSLIPDAICSVYRYSVGVSLPSFNYWSWKLCLEPGCQALNRLTSNKNPVDSTQHRAWGHWIRKIACHWLSYSFAGHFRLTGIILMWYQYLVVGLNTSKGSIDQLKKAPILQRHNPDCSPTSQTD